MSNKEQEWVSVDNVSQVKDGQRISYHFNYSFTAGTDDDQRFARIRRGKCDSITHNGKIGSYDIFNNRECTNIKILNEHKKPNRKKNVTVEVKIHLDYWSCPIKYFFTIQFPHMKETQSFVQSVMYSRKWNALRAAKKYCEQFGLKYVIVK